MSKQSLLRLACLVCLVGPAWAQSSVPPDVEELNRAHQADEDERSPIAPKPRPNHVRETPLHLARQIWECRGTDPWQKVYASPDPASRAIGLTQPQIAVSGDPVNGFLAILFYNGKLGYLPASAVHDFHQPDKPGTTCAFAGLDPSNHPVFRFYTSRSDQ